MMQRFFKEKLRIVFAFVIMTAVFIVFMIGTSEKKINSIKKVSIDMYSSAVGLRYDMFNKELSEFENVIRNLSITSGFSDLAYFNDESSDVGQLPDTWQIYSRFSAAVQENKYVTDAYIIFKNNDIQISKVIYSQWYKLSQNPSFGDEIEQLFITQTGILATVALKTEYEKELPKYDSKLSVTELALVVASAVESLASHISEHQNESVLFNDVIRYIDDNFTDSNFSQTDVKDKFSISSKIISKITKQKKNMLFSEYVESYNNFDYTNIRKFRECDTVILALGESYTVTGEARSLSNIELDDSQKLLIKHMQSLGKKIIAVIAAGRPLALGNVEKDLDAILYVWHGGTQTGNAVSDIVFGDCSPSGRLPVTFPRDTGQIPIYYNCPPSGRDCNEYYNETTDIRNYENCSGSPLYPFGYGLSYTEFEYSNISTKKTEYTMEEANSGIECSVEISNIGNYDSKEVVQLYILDNVASMTRPIRELKGAKKIFIKKGETKKIIFTLTYDDFAFYNSEGKFSAEPGTFDIFIGDNSLTSNVKTIKLI